jgi:hypothetical protein
MKRLTAALLTCGIVAGAMLPTVLWIDGATRPGYSLWHHGASQLGLGERAGLQTGNFVLVGILVVGFSIGVRRVLQSGRGANWGPTLLAAAGIGLVVAGTVPTNPALGYPPGEPSIVTPSSVVHQVAGLFLFGGLSGAALVLAPRLREGSRSWATYTRISGLLIIVFAIAAGIAYRLDTQGVWRPAPAGLLEHVSLLAGFGWLIAIGIYLYRNGTVFAPATSTGMRAPA